MPVPTITLTFADGSVLHASDLNTLVTAINQVINQSNTNATNIATKASASDIANVTATANQAISTANTANNTASAALAMARDANTTSETASNAAEDARTTANTALGYADDNSQQIELIKSGYLKFVYIVIAPGIEVQLASATSYDAIAYDNVKKEYSFVVVDRDTMEMKYYANAYGANEIFEKNDAGRWSHPKRNIIFLQGQYFYIGYQNDLYRAQMTKV